MQIGMHVEKSSFERNLPLSLGEDLETKVMVMVRFLWK